MRTNIGLHRAGDDAARAGDDAVARTRATGTGGADDGCREPDILPMRRQEPIWWRCVKPADDSPSVHCLHFAAETFRPGACNYGCRRCIAYPAEPLGTYTCARVGMNESLLPGAFDERSGSAGA